ncbi:MAG: MMPL family transporter [Cyclobacteriaceae bacterium]
MGYQAQFIKYSFSLAEIVPPNDPEMAYFKDFKETFGEDGNIMAIGVKDSAIYKSKKFKQLSLLVKEVSGLEGVNDVLGLPNLKKLHKNKELGQFELKPVFPEIPDDQEKLDSLLQGAANLKFYSGQLINSENGATIILITITKEINNSKNRLQLVDDIVLLGNEFEKATGVKLHYAGLPYVRSVSMAKIKKELNLFLILSISITGLILFLFFRSFKAVIFPLIIIVIIVVWVLGTLSLLGFKITLLTGLIPSIIVVIGIPNSVYMLNKYHQEYARTRDQMKSLRTIIRKIGIVTLITNFTTAVGFLVLVSTDIVILKEFGIVAGINIIATFIVSTILIPCVFSLVSPPSERHLKHLEFKFLNAFLTGLDITVHRHRWLLFMITTTVVVISAIGLSKIEAVSYMVDDIPENSPIKQDLRFFEENFSGIMPLEIVVNTGRKRGVQSMAALKKIDEFESFLDSIEYISQPVSVVSFIKAANQAFYNQLPQFYALPSGRGKEQILKYLKKDSDTDSVSQSFVDPTGQNVRISLKIADIGSNRMDSLVNEVITPRMNEIFGDGKLDARVTGTTLLFIKGNKFLIQNLIQSMVIAFLVISLIMVFLFRNFRMIIISLIPNMIPLLITAGIMGFFNIPLKPSTALIFSIAFGISVDDSIHFLAKYRQELFAHNFNVPMAVSRSLRETGASMIYTSIILFFGFVIFAASDFGGTIALGVLTSLTLLIAMLTNLTVLPALLLKFDSGKRNINKHPLIEQYPEFYHEDEDEEINIDKLKVKKED